MLKKKKRKNKNLISGLQSILIFSRDNFFSKYDGKRLNYIFISELNYYLDKFTIYHHVLIVIPMIYMHLFTFVYRPEDELGCGCMNHDIN